MLLLSLSLGYLFSNTNGIVKLTLVQNDDGFGVSNIRELYKAVKAYGHNVYIVASTSDKSGTGGSLSFATTANLTADTQYGKTTTTP